MRIGLAFSFLVLLQGCSREEPIRVYDAPKEQVVTYTLWGGMYPAEDPTWFFKVSGSTREFQPFAADFDKLMASVRLPNGPENQPLWDLPAGWRLGGPNSAKMADETILFGPQDKPFVMTVGKFKGGFEPNLARWVGQVGLNYASTDKAKYAQPIGTPSKGWRIAIVGPNNPSSRSMMPGR